MQTEASRRHDASKWTGEPDPIPAEALFAALVFAAAGLLIIGAFALH